MPGLIRLYSDVFASKRMLTVRSLAKDKLVQAFLFFSVGRRASSDSVFCNQHHAEPCFALHHAGVTLSSLFERNCLDQWGGYFPKTLKARVSSQSIGVPVSVP